MDSYANDTIRHCYYYSNRISIISIIIGVEIENIIASGRIPN